MPSKRYQVLINKTAEKQLKKLSSEIQRKISAVILSLEIEPRPFGSKKLSGSDRAYRVRVGNYRIIYDIYDDKVVILVLKIGHRKDVYRG